MINWEVIAFWAAIVVAVLTAIVLIISAIKEKMIASFVAVVFLVVSALLIVTLRSNEDVLTVDGFIQSHTLTLPTVIDGDVELETIVDDGSLRELTEQSGETIEHSIDWRQGLEDDDLGAETPQMPEQGDGADAGTEGSPLPEDVHGLDEEATEE